MKKKNVIIGILCLFIFLLNVDVYAYTKQDIIDISYSIKTCSPKTTALVKGYRNSYLRLLNEREVSQKNLNKIYSDIDKAIKILNDNKLCSMDQESSVSKSLKDKLYNLYDDASEILINSPLISTKKKSDTKIIIDSSSKEIKIYQDGTLADIIKTDAKLNYVGLNKNLIFFIALFSIGSLVFFVISFIKKDNFIIKGLVYSFIFILMGLIVFKNQISIGFDMISLMKIKQQSITKDVLTEGNKIISYPLYGNKYATINIKEKSGDIYFGDGADILKRGVGQSNSSVLPGENGTTILSGHNTGVLSALFEIKNGDKIIIQTVYGKFVYNVLYTKVINDTDISSLNEKTDLIIYTCYPNKTLYSNKRLIVYSKLVSDEWLGDKK